MSEVTKHFNEIAKDYDYYKEKNWFYYQNLKALLGSLVPPNKRVLEIGCGTGDLLVSLKPSYGVGMDVSLEMIKLARRKWNKNKKLKFTSSKVDKIQGKFDYIFMSDVVEHLENPDAIFASISKKMSKRTIFVNTMANPKWEPILMLAEKLKLKMPEGKHFRMSSKDFEILIKKNGMRVTKKNRALLMPIYFPWFTDIVNKNLEKHFKNLCFIEYLVARKK